MAPSVDLWKSDQPAGQPFRLMVDNAEQFIRQVWVPRTSKLQFQIDDIPFQATYEPEDNRIKIQIWAILGFLPYSVESVERRRILINILEALRPLAPLKFGVNRENQIVVIQSFTVDDIRFPSYIFTVLIPFLQKSLPYIRLIGECL